MVEAMVEDAGVKADAAGALHGRAGGETRSWPPPPPRCRSPSCRRRRAGPSASPACTCSTRCRAWHWSSCRSRPPPTSEDTRVRAHALCTPWARRAVEVPDLPGLRRQPAAVPLPVHAVRLLEEAGLEPDAGRRLHEARAPGTRWARSSCWTSWAWTSRVAIGEAIGADVPERVRRWSAEGALGRKAGAGFHCLRAAGVCAEPRATVYRSLRLRSDTPCCDVPHSRTSSHSEDRPAPRGPVVFNGGGLTIHHLSSINRRWANRAAALSGCANGKRSSPRANLVQSVRSSRPAQAAARRSRMRTASMRFSRTDSTRIEKPLAGTVSPRRGSRPSSLKTKPPIEL